jgi:hypothetical protein
VVVASLPAEPNRRSDSQRVGKGRNEAMFYLFGTEISTSDGRYLVTALGSLDTRGANEAAEMIALGLSGRRDTVPLTPAMQEAVLAALSGEPPETLVELRTKLKRKTLHVKEW